MERMGIADLLEAIEMYEDIVQKQDEIISQMGALIRKQAMELAQIRSVQAAEREESA